MKVDTGSRQQVCTPLIQKMYRPQRTIKRVVSGQGVGLFTGESVEVSLHPAPAGHGIVFCRTDLPGAPSFMASVPNVKGTLRCTVLGEGSASVQTVEHLLAAVRAYGIDNLRIEVTGSEVPIFDGSAKYFTEMLDAAEIEDLQQNCPVLLLQQPIFWSEGSVHLVAIPSEEYRVSYTLHYPHCSAIGTQFYTVCVDSSHFNQEIAACRTFSIYEEIVPMIEKGLVKGGSLDRSVLIRDGVVANPGGLRYPDEMVRHKILDLIGDLSLLPPFAAHIIAICSGHTSNNAFAKQFLNYLNVENL